MIQINFTTLRVFVPFAIGYFLSYLYRVVNAVIAPDLVADFNINASELGLITSCYLIAFASFQLPLGVLLDRYSPKKVVALLLLFAGVGAFVFALSNTLFGLLIGRALIGFGVSACLMGAFKAYVLWFPEDTWPRVNGFQMAAGGLGALAATVPVEFALKFTDWRVVFIALGIITFLIALVIFIVVPEKKSFNKKKDRFLDQILEVKKVFTSWKFWQIAPLTATSQAAFLSIQGLWAGPWLKDVAKMERMEVATMLLWIAISMVIGFISLGIIAEHLSKAGIKILTSAVSGMCLFILIQFLIILEFVNWVIPLWILFGFFGSTGIIAYAALSQSFPKELSGRVTTAINLLVFIAAFAGQWAIGAIINLWPMSDNGVYSSQGYKAGYSLMLGLQIISLIWFFVSHMKTRKKGADL